MRRKKPKNLTDQLRWLIETSGRTRYRIAKETGIDETALCRFASGERGVSMNVLDKLGEYLELELVAKRPTRKRKKGR